MYDETIFPMYIASTILFVVLVSFLIASFWIQLKKRTAFAMEKSKIIYDQDNRILRVKIEEQEKVMKLLSREIHDHFGQVLNLISLQAQGVTGVEGEKVLIADLERSVEGLINDVQNISHLLNSDYIRGLGLADSLEQEARHLNATKNIECIFEVLGEIEALTAEKELMIFRIAQEAIRNAVKHGRAKQIYIRLEFLPAHVQLSVEDNGRGFDPNEPGFVQGIGLQNMQERTQYLQGQLEICSSVGAGCIVRITVAHTRYEQE